MNCDQDENILICDRNEYILICDQNENILICDQDSNELRSSTSNIEYILSHYGGIKNEEA